MKQFKIRRADGLYSRGGSRPSFSKVGKTWISEKALKMHLNLVAQRGSRNYITGKLPYEDCTLVEFEFKEVGRSNIDMSGFIAEYKAKKIARQKKAAEAFERSELRRLERELAEQKAKLGIK